MLDPFATFNDIRLAFLRYLDSPFRLRYPALLEERRRLLDADRQLYREPLFEPIAPYESSGLAIHEAAAELGIDRDAADFISCALFSQIASSIATSLMRGASHVRERPWLLRRQPAQARLSATCCRSWHSLSRSPNAGGPRPGSPPPPWWNVRGGRRSSQERERENDRRPAALRALFLYPLNALIEDQLGRIRHACDSPKPRAWFSENRPGQRFWFGRYTGATPVPGDPESNTKRSQLKTRLGTMEREWSRAVASAQASGDDRVLNYFQDPHGSEMWSRWDMQEAPPDILITNYSMLNIMLMSDALRSPFSTIPRTGSRKTARRTCFI